MKNYERNNCLFKKNKTKTASLMNAANQSFSINESVRTEPSNNHIIYSLRSEPTVQSIATTLWLVKIQNNTVFILSYSFTFSCCLKTWKRKINRVFLK